MKSANYRIFICLLALCVFFSTNGLALSIHTCLSESSKSISIFSSHDCCKDKKSCAKGPVKNNASFKSKCCSFSISYQKINSSFLVKKNINVLPFLTSQHLSIEVKAKEVFYFYPIFQSPDLSFLNSLKPLPLLI